MFEQDGVKFWAIKSVSQPVINISASGINPTTGWENELKKKSDTVVEFTQTQPGGIVLPVLTPFCTSLVIAYTGQQEITVSYNGKSNTIPVAEPTAEQDMCIGSWLSESPIAVHQGNLNFANVTLASESSCIEVKLGHFDLPAGCATWSNPFRSKRYTFHVRICGPSEGEARAALEECLKSASVGALLAAVLVPIGWAAAWVTFKSALTGCLINKLGSSISVTLWHEERCV